VAQKSFTIFLVGRVRRVIQSILFFSLGFLCAGFLALMVAPAIWRRAVALTRRRIEASVPLSLGEIQADKDRMRAEFAMSTRRLEMSIKAFREKAAAQVIEINRNREELKRLSGERKEKNQAISEIEAKGSELRADLRQKEDQLERVLDRLNEADRALEERALEIDRLGRMYDEAALNSSNRQIELVARETDVERLAGDVSILRDQRKEMDRRLGEVVSENKTVKEALKTEKKRVADLDKKVERLMGTLSDREEKLDRAEKESGRLREQVRGTSGLESDLDADLTAAQSEKIELETQVADLTLQMSTLLSGAKGADVEKAVGTLKEERERLEERLTTLLRENKKLRSDLASYERLKSDGWDEERRENALLREQINDLAAEVVNLTSALDGPESPIRKVISDTVERGASDPHGKITSLADRVRALQKAASTEKVG
jgi:chromosome segregation ATPase